MKEAFCRNIPCISAKDQEALTEKRVLVAGCGGLGCCAVELLARLGVGNITVFDGDRFEPSNLNRQLFAVTAALGKSKALAAKDRCLSVNPDVNITAVEAFLTSENAEEAVKGHDLVIDALDSALSRIILEDACALSGVTIVHGAIDGWMVQVATVTPGSGLLRRLYSANAEKSGKSTLSFVPSLCASVQISEALKLLLGREPYFAGKLLTIDTETADSAVIDI